MSAPVVSIIMNCLNCAKDLHEALESVYSQSYTDWEIIFWDNGSCDQSPEIAQSYGSKVRYFRAEITVPLGEARNCAIAQACGQYIAFLDCDDIWLPTKLEQQVTVLNAQPHCGLVCTDTDIFDGKRVLSRLFAKTAPTRGRAFRELMLHQWISMSSAMVRRTALDSLSHWFDTSLNVCEEADLFYRIAHDWDIDHVDAPLTRWRVHGGNTTFHKFQQFADETLAILAKHQQLYPNYATVYADIVTVLTRRAAFQRGVALWREGKNAQARAAIAPYRYHSLKFRLFWWASYVPGSYFDMAARLYFALPAGFRR